MKLLLKNLLFVVALPGSVAGWVPLYLTRRWELVVPPFGVLQWLAVVLLAVGATILLLCVWEFAVTGRATPAPIDAPQVLVVKGLYRHVRNPMYVGVLTALSGWSLLFRSRDLALYGLCVFIGFHLFVTLYEEPVLHLKFGEQYAHYRANVRRWLPGKAWHG
jgi:protein-S-isoprenylcysteine O-methyltransferase Ste14